MVTVDLNSQGPSLRLEIAEDGWCRVSLFGDRAEFLGGESYAVLRAKICNTLLNRNSLEFFDKVENTPVAWVLALHEKHTSIYVSRNEDLLTFHLQDKTACFFARLDLTEVDCVAWIDQLCGST